MTSNDELNLLALRRCAVGNTLTTEEVNRLADMCKTVLADRSLLKKVISGGQKLRPGEHSSLTKLKRQRRNALLCECAKACYAKMEMPLTYSPGKTAIRSLSLEEQAQKLSEALSIYISRGPWRSDQSKNSCPDEYQGKPQFYFWHAMKELERPVAKEMMEIILTKSAELLVSRGSG